MNWNRSHPAQTLRTGDAPTLARALQATRQRTLALAQAWADASPVVPLADELNPPLWELGHVGWFQEWWIARNRQRALGPACDPLHARPASRLARADVLYDSSAVAHDTRWQLALPGLDATLRYLEAVQADTLALLQDLAPDAGDDALYFWRLVLFHEDMHNEAAVYMAQALGVPVPDALADVGGAPPMLPGGPQEITVPAQTWTLGSAPGGFAFDNELGAHAVELAAFRIDAAPVSWARYLAFVQATGHPLPAHVRHCDGQWEAQRLGRWRPLDKAAPAVHLCCADAEAWCRWAGRRLPTEAEWECAALTQADMAWGTVWEWTASAFEPYPGFVPHPYRDYSAPWFGTRRVLRGASRATSPHLVHPRYRNFFTPDRADIDAGFRSAAD